MKKVAFTLVLNGMPFIQEQYNIIPQVFDEWYIVEGAVSPTHDTSWCSDISKDYYTNEGLSVDGTSEFLDKIQSDTIHIIRKKGLWDGKLEMCNSFIDKIENSILMEFDVDEIWDINVLDSVVKYAKTNNGFDGMLFRCNYYVGPNLVLEQSGGYADRMYEWSRLWKIDNPTRWISHEPPRLRGCVNFLNKDFTQSQGWLFNHYAYVLEEQVRFKENFYNYKDAVKQWKQLQVATDLPCRARDYLNWINDDTRVYAKNFSAK